MTYCADRHEDGWLCILRRDHEDDHLSMDNTKTWKGTPGAPVSWPRGKTLMEVFSVDPITEEDFDPTEIFPAAKRKSFAQLPPSPTGESCDRCGSLNMMRTGTCMTCMDCGNAGGCG